MTGNVIEPRAPVFLRAMGKFALFHRLGLIVYTDFKRKGPHFSHYVS